MKKNLQTKIISITFAAMLACGTFFPADQTDAGEQSFMDKVTDTLSTVAKNLKKEGEEKKKHLQEGSPSNHEDQSKSSDNKEQPASNKEPSTKPAK